MSPPWRYAPEVVLDEEVEQSIDRGEVGRFRKQVLRLPADGEHPELALVRKHRVEGPERGPVVLVHGFAQNRYTWHLSGRSMVNWLAARGWDVYNLELRGHGRSRPQDMDRGERFADYVADVARVARWLDGRAVFVGHSLGGGAIYAASTRAEMAGVAGIGALFHFGQANGFLGLLGRLTWHNRALLTPHLSLRTRSVGALLSHLYAVTDIAGYAFPVSGWWPGSMEPELLEERLVRGFDWTSAQVWMDMSRWAATGRWDDWEDAWAAASAAPPVLVIAGDRDHLVPPRDARVAFDRAEGRDRTLVLLNDYDHEVHWGHLDLVLGRRAADYTWPILHDWMAARSGI
ncbi:MAG: alpha/beta fold hydrolase [Alphaproteobacteria bacterium]|nr:alpha/beta fold hydrolase [Alphaproteobacteria bacterium]